MSQIAGARVADTGAEICCKATVREHDKVGNCDVWYNGGMMTNSFAANSKPASALRLADVDNDTWDNFVAHRANGHLLQTSRWGAFKSQSGWEATRVAVGDQNGIVAGALILFRPLPFGQRLAYIPKGPAGPWWEPAVGEALFSAVHRAVRDRGAFMLKVEPEERDGELAASALEEAGFRSSPQTVQPRSTTWVDLTGSEEEIRARMKSKFRYNIGLALRKGIIVREGTREDLPAFGRLMEKTGQRDVFALHSADYYQLAYDLFSEIDACKLLLATYQDQVLAGLVVFAYAGRAWYMYGASSNQERNRMPNHALQWAAISWARQQGCHAYDLWGIPDEVGQTPDRFEQTVTDRRDGLWGVYRFKQGFGGEVIRYVGAYDYIYAPLRYQLYQLALRLRRSGLISG